MQSGNDIIAWFRRFFGMEAPQSDDIDSNRVLPDINVVTLHRLLFLLLPALENKGISLTPDRYIRLKRLIVALPADTPLAVWRMYFCPVFATDEMQQQAFYNLYDQIAKDLIPSEQLEKNQNNAPDSKAEPSNRTAETHKTKLPEKPENPAPKKPSPDQTSPARRPLVVELDECTAPPYSWNIVPEQENIQVETGPVLGKTLLQLRRRETADYELPDLKASVLATIAEGGIPVFRYLRPTRPTEYLLLVERYALDDHRAGLFDYFYKTLRDNEVLIERFFYQGDLRSARNESFPAGLSLSQLRYRYPDARLVVMGSGYRLISTKTGELASWTSPLTGWRRRVLLTPVARTDWGQRERTLEGIFTLLPASFQSLHYLSDTTDEALHGQYDSLPEYIRRIAEVEPVEIGNPLIRSLKRHFDPGTLCWIAACAVYPALHFELTLRLGRLVSGSLGYNLVHTNNLLALTRLPWFTGGHIPAAARTELLDYLEQRHPEQHRLVLAYLRQLMQNNPPPENSVAWAEHQINLALLSTTSDSPPDEETLQQLRAVIKYLDRPEKRDDFVLPRHWEALLRQIGFEAEESKPVEKEEQWDVKLKPRMIFGEIYRLQEMIGRGGYGQVWQAQKKDNTKVALKIFTGGELFYEFTQKEFEFTNRFDHPNIIRMVRCGIADGFPYQEMPLYAKGSPAYQAGQLEESDLWKITRDIASALHYLHQQSFLHNDIKPDQFLTGSDDNYVLTDFGQSIDPHLDATKFLVKTVLVAYSPPEFIANQKPTSASDIWALGASLYYLATGELPFDGHGGQLQQRTGNNSAIPSLPVQFSNTLNMLIGQCMALKPEERPTAAEINGQAREWLDEDFTSNRIKDENIDKGIDKPLKTFIIYAHEDQKYRDALLRQLEPLVRSNEISIWHDGELKAGQLWDEQIKKALHESELFLYLVSPDALNSDYIQSIELKIIMERGSSELNRFVPIIIRPCAWEIDPVLRDIQVLPIKGMPISKFQNEHEAWMDVANGIREVIRFMREERAKQPDFIVETEQPLNVTSSKQTPAVPLPEMIPVQGGTFTMGSPKSEKDRIDTETEHPVTLSDFEIGKYPVTVEQYLAFVAETDSHHPEWLEKGSTYNIHSGTDDHYKKIGESLQSNEHPIVGVSWHDATAYSHWLSIKTGKKYRLPTEAEWEFAARGGMASKKFKYSGSNDLDIVGWFSENSDSKTHPVGQKKANELGMYDMSGNVWEWCEDWYGAYENREKPDLNPSGPAKGAYRVSRGGSWLNGARNCRVAYRNFNSPGNRDYRLGFRLASSSQ